MYLPKLGKSMSKQKQLTDKNNQAIVKKQIKFSQTITC